MNRNLLNGKIYDMKKRKRERERNGKKNKKESKQSSV
jgi:hypothetical protein